MVFRTDLALEQTQHLGSDLPPGVTLDEQTQEDVKIYTIEIKTPDAARKMGKPMGRYITVDGRPFETTVEDDEAQVKAAAEALRKLLPENGLMLVVGLGNEHITPDALGPRVVDHIITTRHIEKSVAQSVGLEGMRPVAAIAPGVLAQTGIEAAEIARWVADQTKPAVVVAVDALAASESDRLGRTIQMSDAGIVPGSGVQGSRKALSVETLKMPVISMGVPTVVDASVFVYSFLEQKGTAPPKGQKEQSAPLMVTPHQIDLIIQRSAKIIALAINIAAQSALSPEDVRYLMS